MVLSTNVADNDPDHAGLHNAERAEINAARSRSSVSTTAFSAALVLDFSTTAMTKVSATGNVTSVAVGGVLDGLTDCNSAVAVITNAAASSITVDLSAAPVYAGDAALSVVALQPGGVLRLVLWSHDWSSGWFVDSVVAVAGGTSTAPTFVAAAAPSARFTSGTARTITVPAGTQGGDLILVQAATTKGGESTAPTGHTASGFTEHAFGSLAGGDYVPRTSVLWKIASGTVGLASPDVGTTVTVDSVGDGDGTVGLEVWRGVGSIRAGTAFDYSGGGVWADPPAVSTSDDNDVVLVWAGVEDASPASRGDISGFTATYDTAGDHNRGVSSWRRPPASAGTVNPAAPDGDAPGNSVVATIVLAP